MCCGGTLLKHKQPGHEVDHVPPTSAKFKNAWSHTYTSTYTHVIEVNQSTD